MACSQVVKEGFLVKKGHVRHNWRTRWFVLRQHQLSYFKKRGDSSSAGVIALVGATLECPSPHVTKKPWILHLKTYEGKDYQIQAPDELTREQWSTAIEECIRSLDPSKIGSFETLTRSLSDASVHTLDTQRDIVKAMQDPVAGVKLIEFGSKRVTKYFTGKDIVDWLISWSFAPQRTSATDLATSMLRHGFFHNVHVDPCTRVAILSTDVMFSKNVVDNEDAKYVFVSLTPTSGWEVFESDDDSSSDSDEDVLTFSTKTSALNGFGCNEQITKTGFLLKKSRMTKKWKPRRFVLKEKSQYLYYYRGSKSQKHRGCIPLTDLTVYELDDEGTELTSSNLSEKRKSKSLKQKFNRFLLITAVGERYVLEASSAEERNSWIGEIRIAITALHGSVG